MILAPILLKLEALGIKWQMDVPKACYVGKMPDKFISILWWGIKEAILQLPEFLLVQGSEKADGQVYARIERSPNGSAWMDVST